MTRPLDLEKVKQAWQLRRDGKQQKEIAEVLSLSLRHIQNYLSLDWLAHRSMRVLLKGGAEEVNEQLRALWSIGETSSANGTRKSKQSSAGDDLAKESPGAEGAACDAPDQWPDVSRLESWGVPKYAAPGFLSAWRRAHHRETHELCGLWADLSVNVQAQIPFPDAYDLAVAHWLADRWGLDSLKSITELYRLYRPWEGKVHRRVYLDEVKAVVSNGSGDGDATVGGPLFESLPRRFLYGLPRRPGYGENINGSDDDDD